MVFCLDMADDFGNFTFRQVVWLARKIQPAVPVELLDVRQRYLESFSAALPPRKVLRFYQIENKIDAVLRYELAASIPVLDD